MYTFQNTPQPLIRKKLNIKYSFLIILLVVFILAYFILSKSVIRKTQLLDGSSGNPIGNAIVYIEAPRDARCFSLSSKVSCPIAGKWIGESDDKGYMRHSPEVKKFNMPTIRVIRQNDTWEGDDLTFEHIFDKKLELDPIYMLNQGMYRLKLVANNSHKNISDSQVWFINESQCRPPQCSNYKFDGKTNSLGNLYFPESLFDKNREWIYVEGFKPKALDEKSPFGHEVWLTEE
ncbi:hypothetical protein HYW83_01480 [Candidatus Peregrinibacteria bacterium]|nr:hypothetical protein [Candidatus Peregrinibacteria bacterium]